MNERIVCAANQDQYGYIVLGVRHHDPLMNENIRAAHGCYNPIIGDFEEQGFITNRGRFVDRQEAWQIAVREGQILHRAGGDDAEGGTLYSENLY